jgi:N-[(2S)-2-amino-2-carboxyethyl]-L-glutamate dehydrogenase
MPDFFVVPGYAVAEILKEKKSDIVSLVASTYLLHSEGKTVNPDSYFLRFPDSNLNRIIALPSSIGDERPIAGIKWVSSFPGNIAMGLPRASAITILNDAQTGIPLACIEGSLISAARTAASAALAAYHLNKGAPALESLGVIGAGPIARETLRYLAATFDSLTDVYIYDLSDERASEFSEFAWQELALNCTPVISSREAFAADLILLATTAGSPYLTAPDLLRPGQVVLNVSLRDLDPQLILAGWNICDDVEHCLKAQTSPHLAALLAGTRDFIAGTLADLMLGGITPDRSKPLIFSPFGLGVLDLALARVVFEIAVATGDAVKIQDFVGYPNEPVGFR